MANNDKQIVLGLDIPKTAAQINTDIKKLQSQLKSIDVKTNIDTDKETEGFLRRLAKLGTSFKSQISQAVQSFTKMFSLNSAVTRLVSETQKAISELKEIDSLLTSISITNDRLSKSDLSKLGDNAYAVAAKYGKSPADYLSGVQEASRAGYKNAEGIAELSVAAQSTGGLTAELANQYIFAADKAYQMGGSIEKLTEVLDGSNNITNHNAVTMSELAEGMSAAGSKAASLGVKAGEAAAILGTMIAATQQSGSDMAGAFQSILLYLQQITDAEKGIDAEGLAKYEAACMALNVSLRETKNGVSSLRDPMEVIRDLAAEYSRLDSGDARRSDLLSAVGGKVNANALNAILDNYDLYVKMLQEYASGAGSMAAEAEKMANSWEGSLNRLSNTWADTIENIADSDALVTVMNGLNGLLSVVNTITDKLGSLGTLGLGAGIFAGLKNVGSPKMFGLKFVLNIPTVC